MTQTTDLGGLIDRLSHTANREITAIAGPPGAGKSTLAGQLADALNRNSPGIAAIFPMDGYHFDDLVLNERGHRLRKGAPHTFDVAGYNHMLGRLRRNDETEVAVPVFDREIEISRAGARIIPQSVRHIITEGNYLLLNQPPWTELRPLFDQTVFVDVPRDILAQRLRQRWQHLPDDLAQRKLEANDLPNADLVLSQSNSADYIISGQYE